MYLLLHVIILLVLPLPVHLHLILLYESENRCCSIFFQSVLTFATSVFLTKITTESSLFVLLAIVYLKDEKLLTFTGIAFTLICQENPLNRSNGMTANKTIHHLRSECLNRVCRD